MKFIVLLFLLLLVACSSKQAPSVPTKKQTIKLLVEVDGVSKSLMLPLEFKNGLALITSDQINKELNLSVKNNPFDYSDPQFVKVQTEVPSGTFKFSSWGSKIGYRWLGQYVIGFVELDQWKYSVIHNGPVEITLITRKESNIDHMFGDVALTKISKKFTELLGPNSDVLTFVELDWAPISGGPIGENVFAFFNQKSVSEADQKSLMRDLGWRAKDSTKDYVLTYYGQDGWNNYLLGTWAHEYAHSYFGFGLTREKITKPHELWFSLGLGMVYDVAITQDLTGKYPVIFADSAKILKSYSLNPQIDQHLIDPVTTNDERFGLDRKKVYAHSKAHIFLNYLRITIGKEKFDHAVKSYLKSCQTCRHGYSDFKRFLPKDSSTLSKIEKEFGL